MMLIAHKQRPVRHFAELGPM